MPAFGRDDFTMRQADLADLPACYRICMLTGDLGNDATPQNDDPVILGHLYIGNYIVLEPELAFVIDGPNGVAGYVCGARDSRRFYARMEKEWLPQLRRRIKDPGPDETTWRMSDGKRRMVHDFSPYLPSWLEADYPSHGHIDLLPEAQGHGWGRRLLEALMEKLAADGSPGLHLGVARDNLPALAFYRKLGLVQLETPDMDPGGVIMAKRLR